jgi:hypothetical protein
VFHWWALVLAESSIPITRDLVCYYRDSFIQILYLVFDCITIASPSNNVLLQYHQIQHKMHIIIVVIVHIKVLCNNLNFFFYEVLSYSHKIFTVSLVFSLLFVLWVAVNSSS